MRGSVGRVGAAAVVVIALALLIHLAVAGAPSAAVTGGAAFLLLVAGVLAMRVPERVVVERVEVEVPAPSPDPVVAETQAAPEPKERESSVLVASILSVEGSARLREDLERVLSGIVADERGKISKLDGADIFATFRRSNHAAAAVHAAQRMLSNVDALARRLEREIRISIAVHSGSGLLDEGALEIAKLTRDKRVPVLMSAETRSRAGAEGAALALVDEQPFPIFSFAPVQRTLF